MQKSFLMFSILCVLLLACKGIDRIKDSLSNVPPYEKYVKSLEKAELDETLMAKLWIKAGENALKDSIQVTLPFSESGYFKASEPGARSYTFQANEGQVLTANGAVVAKDGARLFLDLFVWDESEWKPIAHGDSTFNLTYEFTKQQQRYLMRIQPELLASVYYTLNLSLTPVLINPVAGANNKSIGSFYGDSRDGGKRKHEGVDIFAKKGTPVIAPTDGYISRVHTSKLGGKVIWLQDPKRGHSYYFAHLDSQAVKPGMKVSQGHILGTVGNTGNARYTPAHLHFGIYQSKAKDPITYIKTLEAVTNTLPWDTTLTQPDFKVIAKQVFLRSGPNEKHGPKDTLNAGTYVKVIAHSNKWYRVLLPNETQGFISKSRVAPIVKGKRERIKKPGTLLSEMNAESSPLAYLNPKTSVEVLAHFENFRFVRTKDGLVGWLSI